MNVLEFLDFEGKDFDIGDKTYDITVTCCQSSDFAQALKDYEAGRKVEYYSLFNAQLFSKVQMVSGGDHPVADWAKLIEDNTEVFKEFARKHWIADYADKDEFIYEWIKELDSYIAGYVSESFYKVICEELTPNLKSAPELQEPQR